MNKDKLKLIVRNLELLVDSLKTEIYSDTESYLQDNPKVIIFLKSMTRCTMMTMGIQINGKNKRTYQNA